MHGTRNQKWEEKKVKRKSRLKRAFKLFILVNLFFLFVGVVGATVLVMKYKPVYEGLVKQANEKVASINESTFKDKTETVIYDNKGNVLKELAIHDYYYLPEKEIPQKVKDAVIAIEDERYYQHEGYDKKAIARAFYHLVKNKGQITQGGSTITQQLVKLQFLTLEKSYKRKIEEVLIAVELEKIYSKKQILEYYLNNINYGHGAYGIETASITYFNKPSNQLTLSEIAFLTAIPNNPSIYDPVKNKENTLKRRDLILRKMKELGYISEQERFTASEQEIVLNMPERKAEAETYAVSFAISSATKLLMEQEGFEFRYWFDTNEEREEYVTAYNDKFMEMNKKIRNGGYQIHTTIDMGKQALLQEKLNEHLSEYKKKDTETGLYLTQGASVTIDNETGDVVAIVGGRTQEDVDNTFNRAFLSYRQPGSTIKPLVAYTPAIERGMIGYTVMEDKKIEDGPENAWRSYRGKVKLREAVERSINTIPYQIVTQYKPKTALDYLIKMKFSNLVPADDHAGIAVGGFTYGTNPLEMAGAYSTLARNGEFIEPTGIQKITNVANEVLYENKHEKERVYDSGSAFLMTDILKGVLTAPHGTGRGYALSNMPSAGKTGTTNDNKDSLFAGYTPYYTTVIWVGNDIPKTLYDTRDAKEMWKDYMTILHKGLPEKDFEMPKGISYMYINPTTGMVDKDDDHGWWKKELITDIYYENQILKERRQKEAERMAEEQRKKELEKKLAQYGITIEEEMELERYAHMKLMELENSHLYSKSDYDTVYGIMDKAKSALNEVKIEEARNSFYHRYLKEVKRIERERYELENPEPIMEVPDIVVPESNLDGDTPDIEDPKPETTKPTPAEEQSQSDPTTTPTTLPVNDSSTP